MSTSAVFILISEKLTICPVVVKSEITGTWLMRFIYYWRCCLNRVWTVG